MTTQNWIPGAGSLGRCIDIHGKYDVASSGLPLFDLKSGGGSWSWNGVDYQLPDNVAIPQVLSAGTGSVQVFSSGFEFAQKLAIDAKINGSYGGFEGEASAHFSSALNMTSTTRLAVLTVDYASYQITLQNAYAGYVSDAVKNDPDFSGIPDDFNGSDPNVVGKFAQFFTKYGTHFIDSVTCGAQLSLYAAADTTHFDTDTEIDAHLKAAYKGLFSIGGSASAAWNSTSSQDFQSLNVSLAVKGGDTDILAVVQPQFGADFSAEYKNWLATVNGKPVPRDFTVSHISHLFSGNTRQALLDASNYFLGNSLQVYADPVSRVGSVATSKWTAVSDGPFTPTGFPSGTFLDNGGMLVVVVDRTTLEKKLAQTHDVSKGRFLIGAEPRNQGGTLATLNYDPILLGDLQPYLTDDNSIIVVLFPYSHSLFAFPSVKFAAFLRQLSPQGGGTAEIDRLANHETSSTDTGFSYVLVGVPNNPGMAFERIAFAGTGAAPTAALAVNRRLRLLPRFAGNKVRYDLFAV